MQDLLSASLSCIYITPSLVQKMYTNKIKMLKKSDLCLIYCESNTWTSVRLHSYRGCHCYCTLSFNSLKCLCTYALPSPFSCECEWKDDEISDTSDLIMFIAGHQEAVMGHWALSCRGEGTEKRNGKSKSSSSDWPYLDIHVSIWKHINAKNNWSINWWWAQS